MLDQFCAAADAAPAGIQRPRKWDDQLKSAAAARLADEDDPAGIWAEACAYLPTDNHYSGRDRATREERWRKWKCSLEFLVSPSGWRKVTEKMVEQRDAAKRADAERAERDAEMARRREQVEAEKAEKLRQIREREAQGGGMRRNDLADLIGRIGHGGRVA